MEYVHGVPLKDVIQDFKRVSVPIKTDQEVFMLLPGDRSVKQNLIKGAANIRHINAVLEGRRLEDDFFIHKASIPQNRGIDNEFTKRTPVQDKPLLAVAG
jgi:hypothetical protein